MNTETGMGWWQQTRACMLSDLVIVCKLRLKKIQTTSVSDGSAANTYEVSRAKKAKAVTVATSRTAEKACPLN
jgi:hypothetical protein